MKAQPNHSLLPFNMNEYAAPASGPIYWKEIYNGETIRAGYYHLKAGAKDDQTPHDFDEIYWVEKGSAKIRIGEKNYEVKKGDIIYVQAQQIHYFHDITEDLDLLVLFSKGPFDPTENVSQIDHIDQLMLKRDNSKNVWLDFIKKKSMTFGLYMLPGAMGGDKPITHPFDEINFVISGKGSFTTGDQKIEVGAGSLFVVEKNTPHHFETVEGLDVLILFETKSVQ
jgi:mannose-6-phosphate isomerase-like protein (cupin superfamily)